jgi:hypothetical protein
MITDMDVDHPERDQNWDRAARSETQTERLDRNWSSLLQERRVVSAAHRFALGGLLLLGLALAGVTTVVFDAVAGRTATLVAGGCAAVAFAAVWLALPLGMRSGDEQPPAP